MSCPIWGFGTKMLSYRQFKHYFDHRFRVHYDDGHLKELNKGTTATKIRSYGHYWNIQRGGWHFSYMGGPQAVITKLNAFAEQDFNTPDAKNPENIKRRLETSISGPHPTRYVVKLNAAMPRYLRENPEKFAQHLYGGGTFDTDSVWPKRTWRDKLEQIWDVYHHII